MAGETLFDRLADTSTDVSIDFRSVLSDARMINEEIAHFQTWRWVNAFDRSKVFILSSATRTK